MLNMLKGPSMPWLFNLMRMDLLVSYPKYPLAREQWSVCGCLTMVTTTKQKYTNVPVHVCSPPPGYIRMQGSHQKCEKIP